MLMSSSHALSLSMSPCPTFPFLPSPRRYRRYVGNNWRRRVSVREEGRRSEGHCVGRAVSRFTTCSVRIHFRASGFGTMHLLFSLSLSLSLSSCNAHGDVFFQCHPSHPELFCTYFLSSLTIDHYRCLLSYYRSLSLSPLSLSITIAVSVVLVVGIPPWVCCHTRRCCTVIVNVMDWDDLDSQSMDVSHPAEIDAVTLAYSCGGSR